MASNQTENYGLNQWEAGDAVLHTDFNADNAKIDAAITALAGSKAEQSALTALQTEVAKKAEQSALTALQTMVAGKGNCQLKVGSYVGTGVSPVTITTGFPPQLFITSDSSVGVAVRGFSMIRFISSTTYFGTVTWKDDGLSWTPTNNANDVQCLNAKGVTYYYVAFGLA